ncbi:nitroreductase family protein [Stieleria sp. JC731]|uniref:nitroreductase family protein n=1 Tax=Pirellulaceae TaxID=2691357 RepID=UPI001E46ECCF|nr:nitroreductase family protein [Stieleria sp. JC731]MCC9602604.1 nitroreductase family protein [Stieleria sp. JC731]
MPDPTELTTPEFRSVAKTIKSRVTLKVLADTANPFELSEANVQSNNAIVLESLEVAGMAPFHYDRGVDSIAEPWRASVLWHEDCRRVAALLDQWGGSESSAGKLPAMFSACGAAVLITWLPQFRNAAEAKQEQVDVDDEHLAATSAMVQNLLLLLTASGMGTYWSSGGILKLPHVNQRLGISNGEKLIALVFAEYPETMQLAAERKPGKHRDSRSHRWIRTVNL